MRVKSVLSRRNACNPRPAVFFFTCVAVVLGSCFVSTTNSGLRSRLCQIPSASASGKDDGRSSGVEAGSHTNAADRETTNAERRMLSCLLSEVDAPDDLTDAKFYRCNSCVYQWLSPSPLLRVCRKYLQVRERRRCMSFSEL